jgi:outer membrane protein assembly factor BamB
MLWEIPVAESHGRSEIERIVDVDVQGVVVGKVLYAAAYQGKLVAFNLESGRIVWSREISTYSGMDVDAGAIYLTDEKGNVMALDLNTGASLWQQESLHGRGLTAPSITGKYLAVADFEGYVHWLARDDGRFVARYRQSRSAILARPLADGDTLYVSSQNGGLSALQLAPQP